MADTEEVDMSDAVIEWLDGDDGDDGEDGEDGILSVEEIIEGVAEKVKQPFGWLIGRRGN